MPDVAQGNYLLVRRSIVDKVLPTQKDVPLLAHAREVDIHDTEMMMGDDDGFLSVVVANRLPLPGRDAQGREVPVTYLCALINLEGQFNVLRRESPPQRTFSDYAVLEINELVLDAADSDHMIMGTTKAAEIWKGTAVNTVANLGGGGPHAAGMEVLATRKASVVKESPIVSAQLREGWATGTAAASDSVYAKMAQPFGKLADTSGLFQLFDPQYRFPVLLHWSFTSVGQVTFRGLMDHLDSGLLGTLPPEPAVPPDPRTRCGHRAARPGCCRSRSWRPVTSASTSARVAATPCVPGTAGRCCRTLPTPRPTVSRSRTPPTSCVRSCPTDARTSLSQWPSRSGACWR